MQATRRLNVLAGQLLAVTDSTDTSRAESGLQVQHCSSNAAGGGILTGKVAIVTGSGNGIGEAVAKLFADQGAAVVVCDLDGAAADKVAKEILDAGGRAVSLAADVTHTDAPAKVIKTAVDNFGNTIDILVNNAGFTWDGVIQKMSQKQWETMLLVHCTAPFRFVQAVEPHMRGAGKRELDAGKQPTPRYIINISSTTGTHGNAGQINYATAKAGVVGMTKSIAKEWGPFGVRCNAIAFGLIDTRLTRSKEAGAAIDVGGQKVPLGIPNADNYWATVKAAIPLRRTGDVDEAAGAIMMFVTPWSSYVTGQVLEVNGGAFM